LYTIFISFFNLLAISSNISKICLVPFSSVPKHMSTKIPSTRSTCMSTFCIYEALVLFCNVVTDFDFTCIIYLLLFVEACNFCVISQELYYSGSWTIVFSRNSMHGNNFGWIDWQVDFVLEILSRLSGRYSLRFSGSW